MTRRSIVAAVSICIHVTVLIALMTADLWRPVSEWPTPRSAMAFVEPPRPVHLEDVQIQPARSNAPRPSAAQPTSPPAAEAAPLVTPAGINEETSAELPLVIGTQGPGGFESAALGLGESDTPNGPPPPQSQPPAPIPLCSGIRAPQRIVNVAPVYPTIARSAHVEGLVIIEATIDEHGNVVHTLILRSIPLLDDAALTAVRQWKFSPTLLNGIPVPLVMTVTVNFRLD